MWKPGNDKYGIFPMIIGSLYITGGAIVVGVPIGIFLLQYFLQSIVRKDFIKL